MKEITRILLAIKSKEPLHPFHHTIIRFICDALVNIFLALFWTVTFALHWLFPHLLQLTQSTIFFFLFPLQVLAAMLRWVTHDLNNRTQELKELLNFIRVPFVSSSYLKSLIQCCEQGMRTEFKVLLIEAFTVSNLRWIIEMESKRNVRCYNPPKDHKLFAFLTGD